MDAPSSVPGALRCVQLVGGGQQGCGEHARVSRVGFSGGAAPHHPRGTMGDANDEVRASRYVFGHGHVPDSTPGSQMSNATPFFVRGLMSREEAAYYLRMSTRKFNDLIQRRDVVPIRLDGMKLYRRADLDEYIAGLPEWVD